MTTTAARAALRDLLDGRQIVVAPGVFDGISAQLVLRTGQSAAYLTGAGVAASAFGLPDIGLVTASEMIERVRMIVGALGDPVDRGRRHRIRGTHQCRAHLLGPQLSTDFDVSRGR